MSQRRLLFRAFIMGAFLVAAVPSVSLGSDERIRLAAVASPAFPLDGLSFGDLKRLYMGDRVSAAGRLLIPLAQVVHSPERVSFDRSVLGMDADAVARYWIDRKIRGQSGPPRTIDSGEVLVRVVSKVEGAIGYVRPSAVGPGVKVLRIDGRTPEDAGYRLNDQ